MDRLRRIAILICAVPALWQLALMMTAIAGRIGYPYDLEWMEGGMLDSARRVVDGSGLYVAPSVDFVGFLYTPLYPFVLGALGKVFGLGYLLGRVIAVLSTAGLCVMVAWIPVREAASGRRWLALAAGLCGVGIVAATYPFVEGWYDIVRGDMLFIALCVLGLWLLWRALEREPGGRYWHRGVAIAAAVLALSYFAKQLGVMFVGVGGLAVLWRGWRLAPLYGVVAGLIGGGGSLAMNLATKGWFWVYAFGYLDGHDKNANRFWNAFVLCFGRYPILTAWLAVALIGVVALGVRRRALTGSMRAFIYWFGAWVAALLAGASAWANQWAHFNSFILAMVMGAIAGGVAVVAFAESIVWPRVRWGIPAVVMLLLGLQLLLRPWQPKKLMPTAADRAAGDKLVARLRGIDGPVFMPFHPWYPVLAGKPAFAHRMGIMDAQYIPQDPAKRGNVPPEAHKVAGLAEAIRAKYFAAIILDDRSQAIGELPGLTSFYEKKLVLPRDERPRCFTGATPVPDTIWLPRP